MQNCSDYHDLKLLGTSFSRRRPPPPGSALPIISSISSSATSSSASPQSIPISSHHTDTHTSPVTLAAPRPETERLANEYVDTPFRTPKTFSRVQHGVHTAHPTHANTHQLSSIRHSDRHQNATGDKISTVHHTLHGATGDHISTAHSVIGRTPISLATSAATSTDGKCHTKSQSSHNGKIECIEHIKRLYDMNEH